MSFTEELAAFRASHPDIRWAEVFMVDLNGAQRGKLVPVETLEKLASGGMKMPVSTMALDVFGVDVEEAAIAIERGDPDGVLVPVEGSLAALPWAEGCAQVQVQVLEIDGSVCAYDPRAALQAVAEKARAAGLTPVMALELEFFLVDAETSQPPINPSAGGRMSTSQVYNMTATSSFAPILSEMAEAARAVGAPADVVIAEFGPGQFEMNLTHVADACRAADHLVWLKRAIRGVARKHGMDATFMPKPYGDMAGSGMHLHLSLLDGEGRNIFDGPGDPNPRVREALAGLIETMSEAMLIFAPHPNSYRRLAPGSYAPIVAAWGLDNRGSALRVPETTGKGARIEHRTAGADANPYLLAAAVLGGVLHGLENELTPPEPVETEAGPADGVPLPLSWWAAEKSFSDSDFIAQTFGAELQRVMGAQKRQERATYQARVPDTEYAIYLRNF